VKLIEKRKNQRKLKKDIVVIYHGNCTDGFSAAWAAWNKLGDKAEYIGIDPDESPDRSIVGKEVYMIDVAYHDGLEKFVADNKKVVIIDHHSTNKEIVELFSEGVFDMNHSAAVLSWKYFNPQKPVPLLLSYVEDVDLWRLKMPNTDEIISALDMFDFSFENWSRIAKDFENQSKFKEYVENGKIVLAYQNKLIERLIANNLRVVEFLGQKVYVVNSPNFSSQIGNIIANKLPPMGIVWYEEKDGSVHVSLRSIGDTDVSKMAKKFGGGGHKHAAGFRVENRSKLPWKTL